jgi:hypothetical protein
MNLDNLKDAWKGLYTPAKNKASLQRMTQENKHPVLKHIRMQVIVETIAFSLLLIFYYDIFDGDKKSWWANFAFAGALITEIFQQIFCYYLCRQGITGGNIKQAIHDQIKKIKKYSYVSVGSRTVTMTGLLIFFGSVIQFTTKKYWLLTLIIIVMFGQLLLLMGVWRKRLGTLQQAHHDLITQPAD